MKTKRCPNCQSDRILPYGGGWVFNLNCKACGMDGPTGESIEDALALWNRLPRTRSRRIGPGTQARMMRMRTVVDIHDVNDTPKPEYL